MEAIQEIARRSRILIVNDNQAKLLPIIVPTAQRDMETRLKALEAGAKDFLTRPYKAA